MDNVEQLLKDLFADELAAIDGTMTLEGSWHEGEDGNSKLEFKFNVAGTEIEADGFYKKWDDLLKAEVLKPGWITFNKFFSYLVKHNTLV